MHRLATSNFKRKSHTCRYSVWLWNRTFGSFLVSAPVDGIVMDKCLTRAGLSAAAPLVFLAVCAADADGSDATSPSWLWLRTCRLCRCLRLLTSPPPVGEATKRNWELILPVTAAGLGCTSSASAFVTTDPGKLILGFSLGMSSSFESPDEVDDDEEVGESSNPVGIGELFEVLFRH